MTPLSEHFTVEEMPVSQVALRRGMDNTPGPVEVASLKRIADTTEQLRSLLGKPIHVDGGYRSPLVDASVGEAHETRRTVVPVRCPRNLRQWLVVRCDGSTSN